MIDCYIPDMSADELEAEVVGACLRDNPSIALVAGRLRPVHFRQDWTRNAYAAVLALWDAGKPVDVLTLGEELGRRKQIHTGADVARLHALWDATPTAALIEHHAAIVRSHALLRFLETAGGEITAMGRSPSGTAEEMIEQAGAKLSALVEGADHGPAALAEVMAQASDSLDERHRAGGGLAGLATGFHALDDWLGGLRPGQLTVLAARPSVGKTALAGCIALHVAAEQGEPVLFVSLEQPRVELAERFLCARGRVNSYCVRRAALSPDDWRRLAAARDALSPAPLFIADDAAQRVLTIAAAARRLRRRPGLGLIVVDYLQLIVPDDRRVSRNEQVGTAARRLRELGRELNVPVLLLCQLNRDAADGKPKLSQLRDSGEIEQHADCVILLSRDGESGPHAIITADVQKHRNGPTGECKLAFHKAHMRFEDFDSAMCAFEKQ